MRIGDWCSGSDRIFFIAEAGVNHNGDLETAKQLVDAACRAGADAVKFQTFDTDSLVTETAETANYQREQVGVECQRDLLKDVELSREHHERLKEYCAASDIEFLSTPFGFETATFLDLLDVPAFKIGSGDLTNHPLLRHVATFGRPIIVSTGMSTLEEVEEAYNVLKDEDPNVSLALLHCVSAYPTPLEEANLRAIRTLSDAFPAPVGFSDHTTVVETPAYAVAAGASIVEKHLTLDRELEGPDHKASLEPDALSRAVSLVRDAARARGDGVKKPTDSERKTMDAARRGLYAARDIDAGERIQNDDIEIKRPPGGIQPERYENVVGSRAAKDITEGASITEADVRLP